MPKLGEKIPIDKKQFEKLCALHCTKADISNYFECSEDTIENFCKKTYRTTFTAIKKVHCSKYTASLRRRMYEKAMEGNPTMMIWLSKQHLGMKDKIEQSGEVVNHNVTETYEDYRDRLAKELENARREKQSIKK